MHLLSRIALLLLGLFIFSHVTASAAPGNTNDLHSTSYETNFYETPSSPTSQASEEISDIQNLLGGSLLGKVFFNMPFERASMTDILAILLLAFVVSKIITRPSSKDKRTDVNNAPYKPTSNGNQNNTPAPPPPGFDPWAKLRSNQNPSSKGKTIPFPGVEPSRENYPTPLDPENQPRENNSNDDFLKGAKLIYIRLHEAWKNQDLEFIRHFTSPKVYQKFLQRDKHDYLDIVRVEAIIIEESLREGAPFITVEFHALAHKPERVGPPLEVKEIWSFLEPASTGTWRLEEL